MLTEDQSQPHHGDYYSPGNIESNRISMIFPSVPLIKECYLIIIALSMKLRLRIEV